MRKIIAVAAIAASALLLGACEDDDRYCTTYSTTYVMSGKVLVPINTCIQYAEVGK